VKGPGTHFSAARAASSGLRSALVLVLVAFFPPLMEAATMPVAVCAQYPQVACTSTNAGVNADVLQIALDTRDQLSPLLQLGGTWRFPVHVIVVMPDDPMVGKVHRAGASVIAHGNTMEIEAVLPYDDPDAKAFVQRQFVTALLWEKIFATTQSFDTHTRLDLVPLWLVEGLNEWLTQDSERNRESVVRRAALAQRAPALADIVAWQDISQDRLLGIYQRSFCYYLVYSLIQNESKRADFQQWLATYSIPNRTSAQLLFPTETGWQHELLDAPERSHELVYTWDESSSALASAEAIIVPAKKAEQSRVYTLDSVLAAKRDDALVAALQKKVFDLTSLELRAHPSWRPILALYRFALTAVISNHPDEARDLIKKAQDQRANEVAYHQKLIDYVNWFEVTKDYAGRTSLFESYFSTAHQMDRMQGDPDHPNPIRADVLQVESRL
jgi:hypothetical protein